MSLTTAATKTSKLAWFFVAIATLASISMPAFATSAPANVPVGVTISPAKEEITLIPGTPATRALIVTNNTSEPITVKLSAEQFKVTNVNYDYSFASTSVAKWVTFKTNNFSLGAGKSEQVAYTLLAPKTAEPGGKYLSLFAEVNLGSRGDIDTISRVGELLYMTVVGKASETGELGGLTVPRIIDKNATWQALVSDTGTLHFDSRWSVTLRSILGSVVKTTSGDSLILPKTTKEVSGAMPLPNVPGIYKASFEIGLGDTPAAHGDLYVVYLPIWLRWALFGLVVVISGLLVLRWRVRRYIQRL